MSDLQLSPKLYDKPDIVDFGQLRTMPQQVQGLQIKKVPQSKLHFHPLSTEPLIPSKNYQQ